MYKRILQRISSVGRTAKSTSKRLRRGIGARIDRRPFLSFFVALGTLLVLIVLSNVLGGQKQSMTAEQTNTKSVTIYQIGSSPKLTVQARVRKSGVITITALTGGVIQKIYVNEGARFYRGQTLVALSSNYQGGNIASLQRKLAQVQRNNVEDVFVQQKELVQKQHDLANELNKQQGETDLSKVQKNATDRQLDIQDKSLDLNREISDIQLQIAQVAEASMYPSAPFTGIVDRVFVKEGQSVNPGTTLMRISEDVKADPVTAIAYVSADVAKKVSLTQPSIVMVGTEQIAIYPFHISQDAVEGLLYAVYYDIPEDYRSMVTEDGFIQIEIPLGSSDTSALAPYVPVDALYQTKEKNYLFVVDHGRAVSRSVKLGAVFGSYVEVLGGLSDGDRVITDRNVIAGDRVHVAN